MGDVSNGHVYITTEQMNYKAKLSHFTKQYLQWSIYTLTPMADVSNGHVYITTEQMNYKAKLSHFIKAMSTVVNLHTYTNG